MKFRRYSIVVVTVLLLSELLAGGRKAVGESLWLKAENSERSMFSDNTARAVGDIVTVIVSETSSMVASLNTSTEKSVENESVLTKIIFDNLFEKDDESPGTGWSSDKAFEGGGTITNRQTLTCRITAMVIDTLPNGNLVLEGVRAVIYSGERQFIVARGIARPEDIGAANTILSERLADARIDVISEGSLSETQKQGFLTRLDAQISPF